MERSVKSTLIIMVCMSSVANAADIFHVKTGNKYEEAVNKSREAIMLQTGTAAALDNASKIALANVSKTVSDNLPVDTAYVYAVGALTYDVGVNKRVTKKFNNPIINNSTGVVSIEKNKGSLVVNISF